MFGAILTDLTEPEAVAWGCSIAVPESLKPLLVSHLPEALIVGCPETNTGATLNCSYRKTDLSSFDVIACGPGLTLDATDFARSVRE